MKIISKDPAGILPVYDIGVPDTHNFTLSNGLVSHNCFNKSHSIAYSKVTYICAWLKAHYPAEFFCGLMTTRSRSLQPKDWAIKAPEYINEARQLGVKIQPPTINSSRIGFTIKDSNVYFGFNAIKDVGMVAARSIVYSRGTKPFTSIKDFTERVNLTKVNSKTFGALVKAGAFDRMGYIRKELLAKSNGIYEWVRHQEEQRTRTLDNIIRQEENAQIEPVLIRRKELQRIQRLKKERNLTLEEEEFLATTKKLRKRILLKVDETPVEFPAVGRHPRISLGVPELMQQAEYIGCYIGTHPATIIYQNSTRIHKAIDGQKQSLAGVVSSIKVIKDRNGREMAFMSFGDGTGMAEAVIFASTFIKLKMNNNIPAPGELIEIYGEVDSVDPLVKVKLYAIQKYRSDNE